MIPNQSRWLGALLAGLFVFLAGLAADRLAAQEPVKPSAGPLPIVPAAIPAQDKETDAEEERRTTIKGVNFIVECNRPRSARLVAEMAELQRKQFAERWLGKELPKWAQPCRIEVEITQDNNHPNAATSMTFPKGEIGNLSIHLKGTLEGILADVLPSQVTHTVIATHFGRPVPRWADEGIAVLNESPEVIQRQSRRVPGFLSEKRTKAFKDLFPLKEYPDDVMTFFVQSHSVVDFLVEFKGRSTLLAFVDDGCAGAWEKSARTHYGCTLDELELAWKNHVTGKAPLPTHSTPEKPPASKPILTPVTAIVANDQQKAEVAWAKDLARDFLQAIDSRHHEGALGLLSPEFAIAIGHVEERAKSRYEFMPYYGEAKIVSETVSPNRLEIVFTGTLQHERAVDGWPEREFRLRVTSRDNRWCVTAFTTQEKQGAKK